MLTDSHCHLHDSAFAGDLDAVLKRADAAGVTKMITVGTSVAESRAALALAERSAPVFATAGIAPHDENPFSEIALDTLCEMARHPNVVAIGEIGLDYHYNTWPPETQRRVFTAQLALAAEINMPVVIHSRDADADMQAILSDFVIELRSRHESPVTDCPPGVMHCFSSNLAMAEACAALGFLISIAGPMTYSKPRALPAVAKALSLDALLIETDAPYLAPQRYRGKRNEPAYVGEVALKIAMVRGEPFEQIARATTRNAERLLGL
ncbi:MAG: TatD family hydrolase [Chloroflexi bacterium]|nr:TatD family hydrolase [Chloroflexota bacterium]